MANRVAVQSRFIRPGRAQRRQTLWLESTEFSTTLASAGSASLVSTLNAAALALRPFTVVRSRGFMFVESDQSAASEYFSVAYGQTVVTEQASAAGIISVPTPALESASDWHVYARSQGLFVLGDATGFVEVGAERSVQIDSKAMRKVDVGEDLVIVLENAVTSSGSIIRSFVRVLIKLH